MSDSEVVSAIALVLKKIYVCLLFDENFKQGR